MNEENNQITNHFTTEIPSEIANEKSIVETEDKKETKEISESSYQLGESAKVIDGVEQSMYDKIKESTNFQERSEMVFTKAVEAELEKRELIVLSQEQQNELAKLKLKLNKKTMREEAKAEHYERKRKAKMLRYGYLYTPYEVEIIDTETGELKKETRYKNFTTNTFINKYKEFAMFYSNLADSTKKIITKTIKIILWVMVILGIGFSLYGLIKWIVNSNIANNIANAQLVKLIG